MTAKQYLRQIRDYDVRAQNYTRYARQCERDIASLRSPRYDSDRVQTSHRADFTDAIDRLVDAQAEANRAVDEFVDMKAKIIKQINALPYPYSEILHKHYVDYEDFTVIYSEMRYTNYQSILNLHGFALNRFAEMWLSDES